MMAGAWPARVAVLLLLGSGLRADLLRTVSAGGVSCEENLVPEDVLAKYVEKECTSDDCTDGILDFYNYKVNNGSSTNLTCVIRASSAPRTDDVTVTADGHLLSNSESAAAVFRLSNDNKTAVKIYNLASVTKDRLYSCNFVHAGLNYSKTLNPAVYLQPQLTKVPMVETLSGQPSSRYAMWRIWNALEDKGDGPIERYMLCYQKLTADESVCDSLAGSWQTWVSTPLSSLDPGSVYRLYVHTARPCSMGLGLASPSVDYTVPCLAPKGRLSISAQSVVTNHEEASINVTWSLASPSNPCDGPMDVTVLLKSSSSWEVIDSATVLPSNQSVTLSASPDTTYEVEAFFHNSQKLKSEVTKQSVVTGSPIPHRPKMRAIYMCNNSSMLAEWRYDGKSPDSVQLYEVLYKKTHDASNVAPSLGCTVRKPFIHLECVIGNLSLSTQYSFTVRAKSSAGYSNESNSMEKELKITVPQPIQSLKNLSRTDQSVELWWHPPTCTGGTELLRYTVSCTTSSTGPPSVSVGPSVNSVNVTGMSADTKYQCTVVPVTKEGMADPRQYTVRTLASRPSPPARPKLDSDGITATSISLRLPATPNASLCKVVVMKLDADSSGKDAGEWTPDALDLCPNYKDSGPDAESLACYTAAQFPATTAGSIVFVVGSSETLGGFFNAPLMTGGHYAVYFGVGVVGDGVPVFSYSRLEEIVVAEHVNKHVDTHVDKHGSGESSPGAGAIVGAVCAVVVVLVVGILGLLTYMRRKKHNLFNIFSRTPAGEKDLELKEKGPLLDGLNGHGSDSGAEDLSRQPDGEPVYDNVELKRYPVLLSELAAYVEQKKKDNGLKKEYNLIPWGLMSKCDVAKRPENKQRNRYGNIIAYDDSRVLLVRDDAEVSSDYINANYIDGYNSPKSYIATQGPLKNTIKDFWHMVWHEHAPTIIMLTNIIEQGKSKCEQYWPDKGATINGYGGLTVSLERTRSWASYDAHYLQLTKGSERRQIVLFHFRDWPDHGVPTQATALLAFLSAVRSGSAGATGPLVSHCSAGVGRTGTYIALDNLLRQAEAEGKVDVYGAVCSMRKQRCNMIQTFDQYVFLHEAILEAELAGNVSIELSAFAERYGKPLPEGELGDQLRAAFGSDAAHGAGEGHTSQFEDEYENLKLVEGGLPEPRAVLGANARRNRDVSVVPCEGTCVPLQCPGLASTDYINACFVDDYLRKGALISTQTPLPDTVGHFWKMLYDRRVSTVVMLNKSTNEEEDEEQQFTVYWPTSTEWSGDYSYVTIKLISESQLDDAPDCGVTVRTFVIIPKYEQGNRSSKLLHTVTQYACDFWPEEHDVPASRTKFINLLLKVFGLCKASAENGPLVVHCLDGAKQTGLYLACHILMQQAIADGVVDVPQVVKLIRRCRPQFICSAEQLRCCYDVIGELIRSRRLPQDTCVDST